MSLTLLDYAVVAIPVIIILAITISLRKQMKSVSDFLAASRCAGRYLISTSSIQTYVAAMMLVTSMESYSKTGVSIGFWNVFIEIVFFVLTIFGVVTYRFRETRCLTFHQLLEVRYSKKLRMFGSFLNVFSGLINFGLVPAVGARFFVYICNWPDTLQVGPLALPTFTLVMFMLMAISLVMTISGGQISVMVTDCVEGLISSVFYLVIAFFILSVISVPQMKYTLLSGGAGNSYVNPFDIGSRLDFNGWFIVLGFIYNVCIYRGSAWMPGFNAAAKTAQEAKMAAILGNWRGYASAAMMALISIGAFTVLNHPDFAAQRHVVDQQVSKLDGHVQGEMLMPTALGMLLIPGVKGAFLAIGLFGLVSSQGLQLHTYGCTLMQDFFLPFRKQPLTPKAHLRALRWTLIGIGIFVCLFSSLYKPADYLTMLATLIGSIYCAGMGPVVWGALYWKRGTAQGAWASMMTGFVLGVAANLIQSFWTYLHLEPLIKALGPDSMWAKRMAEHPDLCPINGLEFSVVIVLCAFTLYVVVSLLTCRTPYDMDRMLHRGKYAVAVEGKAKPQKGFSWGKLIGIDEQFSLGDKVITVATAIWVMSWKILAIGVLLWWLFVGRLSDGWWFNYWLITGLQIPLVLAVITTVWFTWGSVRDMIDLFKDLKTVRRDDTDDGSVRDGHLLSDEHLSKAEFRKMTGEGEAAPADKK